MAYDYAGSWDSTAGHQSNLFRSHSNPQSTPFSTEAAVSHYRSQGVDARKIVLGMPIYGRAFENTEGAGKGYQGVGEGTWENGVFDYKKLPLEGSREFLDREVGASGCFDEGRRKLVSYDTVEMARWKAEYIKKEGLGGAMVCVSFFLPSIISSIFPGCYWTGNREKRKVLMQTQWWESSADKTGDQSLITNVVDVLGKGELDKKQNCLTYPHSKYDNVRKGFED